MKKIVRWGGIVLGGLLLAILLVGGAMYVVGGSNIERTYDVPALASLDVRGDSAQLTRGAHLVDIYGCRDCHGDNLAGNVMEDAPPFRIVASNLTSGAGGVGSTYEVDDWNRAIRHGVKPSGRSVLIMPSAAFHRVADRDIEALIAYLRTVPPVDNELPPTTFKPMGRVLAAGPLKGIDDFEVRTEPARADRPEPGPTAEYGEYLAGVCAYCHGDDMGGMLEPPGPPGMLPAPSLIATGAWSFDEFEHALRTGERPGKEAINPKFMPLALTKTMTDDELRALHTYFGSLFAPRTSG
jgi:mono/diheme cytochrome c family protein